MKKQFVVEIDVPENTGDLCWDHDKTGLQAFHDCVTNALLSHNLYTYTEALGQSARYIEFVEMENKVRASLKVLKPKPENYS